VGVTSIFIIFLPIEFTIILSINSCALLKSAFEVSFLSALTAPRAAANF